MIKAIIFDFWGTLVENGVKSPTKQVQQILHIRKPFSEYVVRMERAMMTEPFPQLRHAFEKVGEEFEITVSESQMEELVGMWNKSWMLAQPYEEVLEVLEILKKKYTLILVSNTDSVSVEKVMQKFKLAPFFKHKFFSYEMGMVKTDPPFLLHVLEKSGLKTDECALVGDSLESDMAAGKQHHIKTILVDRRQARHFSPKIANLRELEGMLHD